MHPEIRETKFIPLTQGKVAIVDSEDFEYLNQWKWYCRNGYAVRQVKDEESSNWRQRTIHMHRVINNTPDDLFTDHINGNRSDNRSQNLRTVTKAENRLNLTNLQKNNRSGFMGVYEQGNKWIAEFKRKKLGSFSTREQAANAYKMARNSL